MGFCCCVFVFYFCEEPFYVKAPRNLSQHLCSVELQDTLILSNTFVNRWGNWNKVIFKFMVEVGFKPRAFEPLLQSSRIQIRQAKLPTLTAIIWMFQGNSVFKKYILWPLWVRISIRHSICHTETNSHRISNRALCPIDIKGKKGTLNFYSFCTKMPNRNGCTAQASNPGVWSFQNPAHN